MCSDGEGVIGHLWLGRCGYDGEGRRWCCVEVHALHPQAQVHHLLAQNKELLAHMQKLIIQIQQLQTVQAMPPKPEVKPVAPSVVDLLLDPIEPPVAIAAT